MSPRSAPGWTFSGWTGAATGTENPIAVLINGPVQLTAHFVPQQFQVDRTLPVTVADFLALARQQAPDAFRFRTNAYEFETQTPAFDLLTGSDAARHALEAGAAPEEVVSLVAPVGPEWSAALAEVETLMAKAHA